ncbi:MAG: acyl-CoA dehydrogenase family protein [Myxococcota bacterium]|nr:acyl-CoA dehydrogenase family protein [Myxococcota bacterium]
MRIDLSPDQQKFSSQVREYFGKIMTPEFRSEMKGSEGGGPLYWEALRRMGEDGWLAAAWPKEYGGRGLTAIENYIFADEAQAAGFPFPFLTMNTVGPTLRDFGSEEVRKEFLPRVLRGEINFAIGYSEPGAGTDLASLTTRAVRDGDEWVINGQKIWTSLANYCQYVWLAARTDPESRKHRGISIFMVPTDDPGFSISPIQTMGGVRTNATFYEDVRVPASWLVGEEGQGWSLITNQLNHERVSLNSAGPCRKLVDDVRDWARETRRADGSRVIDQEWVQMSLARARAQVEVLRIMNWRIAWGSQNGRLHPSAASSVKVFGSEAFVEIYQSLMEVVGTEASLRAGSAGEVLQSRLDSSYKNALILTFGGGTNEVQRDIIAMAGLGMPHYKS